MRYLYCKETLNFKHETINEERHPKEKEECKIWRRQKVERIVGHKKRQLQTERHEGQLELKKKKQRQDTKKEGWIETRDVRQCLKDKERRESR